MSGYTNARGGLMGIIQTFRWFWKLILKIINPHRVKMQRYHLEQEGFVQVLYIVGMFINIIYLMWEFTPVNDSALRIHTCDLKAGLKKGQRGNEGSPVPPVWPIPSLGTEETSALLLNATAAGGKSWLFTCKIFVCGLFCLPSHFQVCRTNSG